MRKLIGFMILGASLSVTQGTLAQTGLSDMVVKGEDMSAEAGGIVKPLPAGQALAEAQYRLGFKYDVAKGVDQDYAQAVKWYRLAAAQGHAKAQGALGQLYARGQGVPKNLCS